MKRDLGIIPAVFPMPVLMVAAYDEHGKVNVMNAGWGQMAAADQIALFISENHKTVKSIRATGAFTVSLADLPHVREADFFGIASGNQMEDKFERTGLHATRSERLNAPIIEEFPLVMECELEDVIDSSIHAIVGRVVNVAADESVLDAHGKVDVSRLQALAVDTFQNTYHVVGEQVGRAFHEGLGYLTTTTTNRTMKERHRS